MEAGGQDRGSKQSGQKIPQPGQEWQWWSWREADDLRDILEVHLNKKS